MTPTEALVACIRASSDDGEPRLVVDHDDAPKFAEWIQAMARLHREGDLMTILDKAPQIDAPIVLREQIEPDGSVSRVTVWLIGDGEGEEQIVISEDAIPLSWDGTLWHGYDKDGELVRLLVNNHER